MRNRKLLCICAILIGSSIISVVDSGQPAKAAERTKVLKIGVSASTTGRFAGWGLATVWGMEQAAAEINEAGGLKVGGQIYTLKVFQYDDKGTTSGGKAAGEYLIAAENVLMVGTLGTPSTIALQEISEPKKVLLFHPCVGGYKKLMGPDKKYTFTHAWGASEISDIMFSYMKERHNVKTIAFLCPDNEGGTGFVADAKVFAEKKGFKIVGSEAFNLQLSDFYPILSKLIKNKPDAIQYCQIPLGVDALITKQLYELGWKGIKSHASAREPAKIVEIAGKDATEGMLVWGIYDFASPNVPAKTKAFYKRYFAEHKEDPSSLAMRIYSAVTIYAEAIKAVDTLDPDRVVAQIEKMGKTGLETLYGPAKLSGADFYGIDHRIGVPNPLCVIEKNGVISFKGTFEPSM